MKKISIDKSTKNKAASNWWKMAPAIALSGILIIGTMIGCGKSSSGGSSGNEPTGPAQTVLIAPTNNGINIPVTATLTWSAASGATSYNVYLAVTTTAWTAITSTTLTAYQPLNLLNYSTTYYWRIDSKNAAGTAAGLIWSFTTQDVPLPETPALLAPADNAGNIPITATLAWSPAAGAASYNVYLSVANPPVFMAASTTGTNYAPSTFNYGMSYYWRIDAVNSYGTVPSQVWSFTIENIPLPDQTIIVAPNDGSGNIPLSQVLQWTSAARADSYDIYFGTANPPAFTANTSLSTYQPVNLLYSTIYYWRVDARNTSGFTPGDVWSFTTESLPYPDPVVLVAPPNQAVNVPITVTLTWQTANRADYYIVIMWIQGVNTWVVTTTAQTSCEVTGLQYSTTYDWQVDSGNATGTTPLTQWQFTTMESPYPAKAIYTNPVDAAIDIARTASLIWESSDKADSYDVYFGLTSEGWSIVTNTAITSYTPDTALLYSAMYYWRIDAKNTAGVTGGEIWSFQTVKNMPPVLAPLADQTISENELLTFKASATDPYSDELIYSADNLPAGAGFDAGTRIFAWTPNYNAAEGGQVGNGIYPDITFRATDPDGLFDEKAITITVINVNRPPHLASPGDQTVGVNQLISFPLSAADPDGDELVYSASNLPLGAIFDTDIWYFYWTPNETQSGIYPNIAFRATDPDGFFDEKTITITVTNVNRPPVLTSPGDQTIEENQAISFTLSATDPDGDELAYSADNLPAGADFDNATATFSWIPDYGQEGIYPNISFRATDTTGLYDEKAITVTVLGSLPVKVTLLNPGNLEENVSITVSLTWSPVVNATSYDVYFGPQITQIDFLTNTANTYLLPTNYYLLAYGTTYFWQIDSRNTYGATPGDVWSFTTMPKPAPGQVTLLSPSNGITDTPVSPTQLSWAAADYAEAYDVYFGISDTILPRVEAYTISTVYNYPNQLEYSTNYSWYIVARNTTGSSDPSSVWSFRTVAAVFQADVMFKKLNDIDYLGQGVYEPNDPVNQVQTYYTGDTQTITYLINIRNDGNISDLLQITGTGAAQGWTVTYYDESNNDIISDITNLGLVIPMATENSITLRLEVTPEIPIPLTASFNSIISAVFLGDLSMQGQDTIKITTEIREWLKISGGYDHSIALNRDGTVWAWGDNSYGQLGIDAVISSTTRVRVTGLTDIVDIAAGGYHCLALDKSGSVWAWGSNFAGQLGIDSLSTSYTSTAISVTGLPEIGTIACGSNHSLAIDINGTVWAWGNNYYGQVGIDNSTVTATSTPVSITGIIGMGEIVAIAGGSNHSLALDKNSTIWAWGNNSSGELGNGTGLNSWMPVNPAEFLGITITAIAAGEYHSMALDAEGMAWAWGFNGNGQLGNGTYDLALTPISLTGLSDITAISAKFSYHSLALDKNGVIWTWGSNSSGQLGDGTNDESLIPISQTGLTNIIVLSAGGAHSLFIQNDGTIWACGNNTYGQLGDGTYEERWTPVLGGIE